MASTYSSSLRIQLITPGEQSGIWGDTTNTNWNLIQQAVAGVQSITMANANYTLTNLNGVSDEARNMVLVVGGTNSAIRQIIAPLVPKVYVVFNNTSGGFAITIGGATGTLATVPSGSSVLVYCNGTNFFSGVSGSAGNFSIAGNNTVSGNESVGGTLTVTGTTALTGAVTGTLTSSGTLAVTGGLTLDGAAGTTGQVMVSAGTGNTPTWGNAFVAGMIMMWSGSIATIPSGWLLCNGTSGTPDLRNRFVIGAFSDNAGVANTTITGSSTQTGGSKDAIVVSHTHTATVTDPGHFHSLPNSNTSQAGNDNGGTASTDTGGRTPTNTTNSATTGISVAISTTGSSATNANLNPYYALAFIMKS